VTINYVENAHGVEARQRNPRVHRHQHDAVARHGLPVIPSRPSSPRAGWGNVAKYARNGINSPLPGACSIGLYRGGEP
jgi:hypothetical protein